MNLSELNELDFSNVGNWSTAAKAITLLLVSTAMLIIGYFVDTSGQRDRLAMLEKKELDLKRQFEQKQAKAANLGSYQKQLEEIQKTFGSLLGQLPSKTEVADLLTDITQTGLTNGLQFDYFKPQGELPKDFYVELPIELIVRGDYHEFGKFMSGVAGLPRIVTIHDFSIQRSKNTGKQKNSSQELILEAKAKTYRYLDDNELEQLSGQSK